MTKRKYESGRKVDINDFFNDPNISKYKREIGKSPYRRIYNEERTDFEYVYTKPFVNWFYSKGKKIEEKISRKDKIIILRFLVKNCYKFYTTDYINERVLKRTKKRRSITFKTLIELNEKDCVLAYQNPHTGYKEPIFTIYKDPKNVKRAWIVWNPNIPIKNFPEIK